LSLSLSLKFQENGERRTQGWYWGTTRRWFHFKHCRHMESPLMPSVLARKLVISVAQPFINFLLLIRLILNHVVTISHSMQHLMTLNLTNMMD
ncbi:unnamed protein product, partial [Prunus brigantina]